MINLDKAIAASVKTGKVIFGTNSVLQNAKSGKTKLIILAANCPKEMKEEIKYYSKFSKVPVIAYKGTSIDLAGVCGKPFIVSAISIRESGDSEILRVKEGTELGNSHGGNK